MLLRIVKEISPEAAQSIVVAMTKIKKLAELNDGIFLCKALEGYEDARWTKEGPKKAILEPLLGFTQPEWELGKGYKNLFYKKAVEGKNLRRLNFTCGPASTYGVSFEIREQTKQKMEFLLGPFIALKSYEYNFSPPGNIYELARFFHNRRGLYQKIYETLAEKKVENGSLLTPAFVEALLLLFSAKTEEEKFEALIIPEKNLKKQLFARKVIGKKMLALGGSYFYPEKYPGQEYPASPVTNLELFLNNKNQLIIDATVDMGWREQSSLKIEALMEQEEFINYINCTLAGWLKQLLAMAAFGEKIYEKVKTKILLETL